MSDGDGTLDIDRYCLSCGYNLRGLPGDPIRCPECGTRNRRGTRYTVRQRLFRWGHVFDIADDRGDRVFTLRTAQFTVRTKYHLLDAGQNELLCVRRRMLSVASEFELLRNGQFVGVLRQSALAIRRRAFSLTKPETGELLLAGESAEWRGLLLRRGDEAIGSTRLPRLALRPTMYVEVARGEDLPVIVAAVIVTELLPY